MSDDTSGTTSTTEPKTDWRRLRSMTDEKIHAAIVDDPDASPTDEAFWKGARVVPPRRMEKVTNRLEADLLENALSAFRQRTFQIDCVEMVLVQNETTSPISFKGKGRIWQAEDDTLKFELRVLEQTNLASFFRSLSSWKPGTLFRKTDFYALSVIGIDGTRWTADRVIPSCGFPAPGAGPVVTGNLSVLSTERSMATANNLLHLHFFDDVELPFVGETFAFSAANYEFVIRKSKNEFVVQAVSRGVLGEDLHLRVQEALRFLLAKSVAWRGLFRQEGTRLLFELSSNTARSSNTKLGPPTGLGHPQTLDYPWRLFSAYLEYVVRTTPRSEMNWCSYHLHNLCEASANSVDAWAIGLSVAVEGIVDLVKKVASPDEKKRLKSLKQNIVDHVSSHPDFSNLAQRVAGALDMMFHDRVQDRLKPMIESGHVDESYIQAWAKLRNKQAHPKKVDLRGVLVTDYHRSMLELIDRTTALMYQIIFHLIGYQGWFIDYGSPGYPLKAYPLSAVK
jgi:hypothetical protein